MKRFFLFFALLVVAVLYANAQKIQRFDPDTLKSVVIDTAVVNIRSHKLNAQDFIDAVLADTSFYKAFHNMKGYDFNAENRIYTFDKKNKIEGKIYRKLHHGDRNGKHFIDIIAKRDSGNIYKKNGKYQLYTVEMFDYIFQNAYNSDFIAPEGLPGGGKNETYKDKLKTLVFLPGHRVSGIPFISGKTEIFSKDLRQYYYYQFSRGTYLDSIPVYRFKVIRKPSTADGDVMIKEITTIFDMRNFQILGRYIDMKYSNLFFDFNVQMNLELNRFNGVLLPTKISYQGNWNIPFHKEERAAFLILHKNYKKEK